MTRCRHPAQWDLFKPLPSGHTLVARHCPRCGELFPLGPSNDRPADVRFEMAFAKATHGYSDETLDEAAELFYNGLPDDHPERGE